MKYLLILLLIACGSEEDPVIDEALQPYLDEYRATCAKYEACASRLTSKLLGLQVKPQPQGQLGVCKNNKVTVTPQNHLSDFDYHSLVYHELAHCIHRLDHDNTSVIMASKRIAIHSEMVWNEAVKELFQNQMERQP